MAIGFDHIGDTNMRLHGTICMYDGKPVLVNVDPDAMNANGIKIKKLGGRHRFVAANVKDDLFSYDAMPLGYASYHGHAYWVSRTSARQQRAGLPRNSLVYEAPFSEEAPMGRDLLWETKELEDCILGVHTPFEIALRQVVTGEVQSVSIQRELAIGLKDNRTLMLALRTRLVGVWDDLHAKFSLFRGPDTSFMERLIPHLHPGVPL